jgi:hypothetical protein
LGFQVSTIVCKGEEAVTDFVKDSDLESVGVKELEEGAECRPASPNPWED